MQIFVSSFALWVVVSNTGCIMKRVFQPGRLSVYSSIYSSRWSWIDIHDWGCDQPFDDEAEITNRGTDAGVPGDICRSSAREIIRQLVESRSAMQIVASAFHVYNLPKSYIQVLYNVFTDAFLYFVYEYKFILLFENRAPNEYIISAELCAYEKRKMAHSLYITEVRVCVSYAYYV